MRASHLIAAAVAAMPAALAAQEDEPLVLEEILVSGGRTPIGVDEIGRAYTVLTREQLEARGDRYVADALRSVPGVSVTRGGSTGGFTEVRIRGAEANQALVLIDGMEVAPAATGALEFGTLQVANIERIEVIRGPQSSLFGSNAAAGVISIVTRGGRRETVDFSASVEGGSDGTTAVSAFVGGGGADWDGAVSASLRRAAGYNIATGTDDREGELDGDTNITLDAKANWDVSEDLRLGTALRFVDRETEFDPQLFPFPADATSGLVVDGDNVTEQRDIAVSGFARYEMLGDALVHEARVEYTDNRTDSLADGALSFRSESRRIEAGLQSSYAFDLGPVSSLATAGMEVEHEINEATTGEQTRTLFGVVGEYRATLFRDFDLQAGLRYDFNDAFEDALTFSVAGSYRIEGTGTRLHASVGRGVVNPTFIEQFGFFPGSFVGNPDLEPERTFQWDIGVEQTLFDGRLVMDATYFRGKVTDEIVSGFDAEAGLQTSVNAPGESPRQGVELSLTARPVAALDLVASYSYILSQDGGTGLQEVRRPRHAASFDAIYRFADDRASLGAGLAYSGDRRDSDFSAGVFPAPLTTLDSYVLLRLQGSYEATENVELFARVENVTDADYQEVLNFETQGVAGFAGVRLNF